MTQRNDGASDRADTEKSPDRSKNQVDNGLMAFLEEMHATMPDVPEEDAQKDIEEAIAAIRNETQD